MPASLDDLVVMGRLGAPFGVKGWVHVQPYSEMDDALADHAVWQVGRLGVWASYELEGFRPQGSKMVAKLVGVDDRDAAFALRGSEVAVPRASLPPAGQNEYYWSDLVGLDVVNVQGDRLGSVDHVIEAGAHDVLVVRGERERLIPFVGQIVLEVSLAARCITVDWQADY